MIEDDPPELDENQLKEVLRDLSVEMLWFALKQLIEFNEAGIKQLDESFGLEPDQDHSSIIKRSRYILEATRPEIL